jgi:hypothetical protein
MKINTKANVNMGIWKNFKKWLGIMAVGTGTIIAPMQARGWQDQVVVKSVIGTSSKYDTESIGHFDGATDGFDDEPYDTIYEQPVWLSDWGPRVTTLIDGNELDLDLRATNSTTKFDCDLSVFIYNGQNISGTNWLEIKIQDTAAYDSFDPKRHYPGEFLVYSNYTSSGKEFRDKKNIRDLCINTNTFYAWDGININILASQTNVNGIVFHGKYTQFCDWNQLISSSGSGGTNNPQGSEILDYNTNKTVSLNANTGNYIDYYVLTRTDNTGLVSVVTNDFPDTSVSSTNVPINNIKGSNSIYAVYASSGPATYTITATNSGPGVGTVSPLEAIVASGGYTNFLASATQPSNRIAAIYKDNNLFWTNSGTLGDNSIISSNITYGPVTNNGNVNVSFEPKKYNLSVNSAHGPVIPATGDYVVSHGTAINFSAQSPTTN